MLWWNLLLAFPQTDWLLLVLFNHNYKLVLQIVYLVLAASKYNYTSIATNCLPMCLYFLPIFVIISIYIILYKKMGEGWGEGGGYEPM